MASFDDRIEAAVQDGVLPGVIMYAKDKTGELDYAKVAGKKSSKPGEVVQLQPDSILLMASGTKLLTTIAALQLVERGLVGLEDDVAVHIPVLAQQEILTGFAGDGSPITRKRENAITLRHLLTHSAGPAYDFLAPQLRRWGSYHKKAAGTTVETVYNLPLMYEPGEGFMYSSSLDWAGKVVEKISGQDLEEYMKEHLFAPLGIKDITFWEETPDIAARRWEMSARDNKTGKTVPYTGHNMFGGMAEPFGGQGIYASLQDYIKVLYSLLIDDEKLLKKETAALMFQPHLSKASKEKLLVIMDHPEWAVGNWPITREYDWGYGGIVVDGDSHEYRKRGALIWSGSSNVFWFLDREAGLCGVFGTQVMPPADVGTKPFIQAFEDEMYARVKNRGSSGKL